MEKERLIHLINELDLKAESNLPDVVEQASKAEAEQKLHALLKEEEMKWALRAKVRQVVQGEHAIFSFDYKWKIQKEEIFSARAG